MLATIDGLHLGKLGLAAASVIGGVVAKNSGTQLQAKNTFLSEVSGMILFAAGWLAVAYLVSQKTNEDSKILVWGSVAAIWLSATQMRRKMDTKERVPLYLPVAFALGWLTFGWVSDHTKEKQLGLIAAGMVLLSMMVFLPWQRKNCIVDGPGMPLFAGAWAIITLVNSLVPETKLNIGKQLLNQLRNVLSF